MEYLPFWKKIYQTITGYSGNITNDIVEEILKLSKNEILQGIVAFEPFTDENFENWKKQKPKLDADVHNFVRRLGRDLNLDSNNAFLLLCNYFMFEYYGKIKEVKSIARYESNTTVLVRNVRQFYVAERMFIIKSLRHIFEYVTDEQYQYYNEYKTFVDAIDFNQLKTTLILQFGNLVKEITPEKAIDCPHIESWVYRNNKEQCETLMLIIIITEYTKFTEKEFETLFSSFMEHSFTRHPLYFESTQMVPASDFFNVKCAEIGCFISLLNQFNSSEQLWKFLSKNIEKDLIEIQVQGNQTIVLFMWIVLKLKQVDAAHDAEDQQYFYLDLMLTLFQRGVLASLHEVMCNDIFKDNRAGDIVLNSIFNLLDLALTWFPDHKFVYSLEGTISITTDILRNKVLLKKCLGSTNRFNSLIRIAIHSFPYDFLSFTKLYSALLESDERFRYALRMLNKMQSFLSELSAAAPDGEYYTLNEEYSIFENIPGITVPAGTRVQSYELFDKNLVRFIWKYSYFTLLRQMFLFLLYNARRLRAVDEDLVYKLVEGYKLVNQIIKHPASTEADIENLQECIKVTDFITSTFLERDLVNFDMIKLFFVLQTNLVMYQNRELRKDFTFMFLPALLKPRCDVIELTYKEIYDKCITTACLQEEESKTTHEFLVQYIDLVHFSVEKDVYHQQIQLPGVTYIVNHVFPFYENWRYTNLKEKNSITSKCLLLFHKILQQSPDNMDETKKKIFTFITHSLLNNRVVIETYFNLLARGNSEIQNAISSETLSPRSKNAEMFRNIRLQLSIVLFLMKLVQRLDDRSLFYEKLKSFIKPLTSFIGNAHNSHIAQLSCRLVEVMARDSNIPMLALLEMDYNQVQSFFLEKLRDPMEDEELKIIIVELIETCIRNQHGMTAAFFNIPTKKQWDSKEEKDKVGDTMTDFMLDYLQNIRKSPHSLENPLQLGILKILLNLWTSHKNNLIEDVVSLKQFWPLLANPLYCSLTQDPEIYSIVFTILSLQMCNVASNIDDNLKQAVEKFFKNRQQMVLWMEFMDKAFQYVPLSSSDERANKNYILLKSWIELIVVTKKYIPSAFDEGVKNLLVEHCLDGTLHHFRAPSHIKMPIAWLELYLVLMTNWNITFDRETVIAEKFTNILIQINNHFNVTPFATRKIYLSVIYKTIEALKPFFEENPNTLQQLLIPVGKMLCYEYDELYYILWNPHKESTLQQQITNWVLVVCIANSILSLKSVTEHSIWFKLNNYIEKIMSLFRPLFYKRQTATIVKFMLESLIRYAKTPMVFDFLTNDIIKITENMKTPENFYLWKESSDNMVPVYLREWCTSYMLLVKLLHILVKKLGHRMVHNSCTFLMLHNKVISEILMLSEHSADKTALMLIREVLDFLHTLMNWKYLWYCCFKDSFFSVITSIKKCLNTCISTVLRPKNLLCYTAAKSGKLEIVNQIPEKHLITLANMFIEISCLASQCLLKANRTLLEYFDVYKSYDPVLEIIENDFKVPKFELPITPNVTFGRLLCLVHFLCKTLNQLPVSDFASNRSDSSIDESQSLLSFSRKTQYNNLPDLLNHYNIQAEDTVVFVQYEEDINVYSSQKLSSFFHYAMYEYSGLAAPWVCQLNRSKVEKTLEVVMSLLASQVFLYTRTMDKNQLPQYKRELCAELLFITEFVKKRASGQQHSMTPSMARGSSESLRSGTKKRKDSGVSEAVSSATSDEVNFLVVISQWFVNICQLYGDNYYTY